MSMILLEATALSEHLTGASLEVRNFKQPSYDPT